MTNWLLAPDNGWLVLFFAGLIISFPLLVLLGALLAPRPPDAYDDPAHWGDHPGPRA